jgi:purine-nucleoside phosphorylase
MTSTTGHDKAAAAAAALRERIGPPPKILLVLGSGMGPMADAVDDAVEVSFDELPGFPPARVEGHAGKYLSGTLEGVGVLVQAGRLHAYEGHPMEMVVLPIRIAVELGIDTVVLTNAAGGIHPQLDAGSLMLLDDHINFMGRGPLTGPVQGEELRFPDMSAPYDPELRALAREAALAERIPLIEGTYAGLLGPSYETPAEVRMLQKLGVDAVGMSTVPETITARASGLRVLAFSLVTNKGSGLSMDTLDHADVVEVGKTAGKDLERILRRVLRSLA